MGAYAWCYYTDDGKQYWTEAFKMSATDFARIISGIMGIDVHPGDLATLNQKDVKSRQRWQDEKFIHIDKRSSY